MTPWVARLLFLNVLMFGLTIVVPGLGDALMFVPALFLSRPWTIVTYMFLHGGFGHIFFNMFALFFFGPRLEARMGSRRFLGLYLASGVMGGLLSFTSPAIGVIGASGAVYGVMFAFAYFWPREVVHIWGVLPIEVRWLVVGLTVVVGGLRVRRSGRRHRPLRTPRRIPGGMDLPEGDGTDQRCEAVPGQGGHAGTARSPPAPPSPGGHISSVRDCTRSISRNSTGSWPSCSWKGSLD